MKKFTLQIMAILIATLAFYNCQPQKDPYTEDMKNRLANFEEVTLATDLSWLSEDEREIIRILLKAADIMDDIFWTQSYGDKEDLFSLMDNDYAREYAKIHYGPWDRLDANRAFVTGYNDKPLGANFYPTDMTREEFEAWDEPSKTSLYTLVRRDREGNLIAIPYSEAYREQHEEAASLMREAAQLAQDEGLRNYLLARSEALLTNEYQPSDFAWMAMKESNIDFVVGPIENYEDRLFGYKAAHEAFILVKDLEWSAQLEKFNAMLPDLQQKLPVAPEYKAEEPGIDADMNV